MYDDGDSDEAPRTDRTLETRGNIQAAPRGNLDRGQAPTVGYVSRQFLQVACGGCGAGVLAGALLNAWVKRARGHYRAVLEVGIVIGSVYGTFLIAEALHTSGVLAVVTLGFIMSAHISAQLSHEGRHAHHVVFGQIGHACNQITFFTSGIISARFLFARSGCFSDHIWLHSAAWLELLGLYATVHLTRAAVVAVFHPLLDRMGYGITWKESAVLVYGGLRGAVGLVMSLVVEHSAARTEHQHASQMIAFHTSGIVLLTLLINGSTVDQVYRWLKLYPMSPFRKTYVQKVLAKLEVECQKGDLKQITRDWFLQDCSLRSIVGCMPNFCHLDFDPAGVPHPAGILSTAEVLRCLEAESNWHMEQTTLQRRLSFTKSFRDRWAQRKLESEERFVELLRGSAGQATDRKDYLSRGVQSFGDRELGPQVRLSFDLVLTTDADCINQLFNVLFNTMRHVYCEMHEHGIIGDVALAWLTEAVGEAMDCAGHEVNARTATDFRKHNATYRMRSSLAAEEGLDAEGRFRGSRVAGVLPSRPHWLPSHLQAPSELLTSVWSLRERDPEGKLAGLFEPILVEYLSIEAMVSKVFFWDALPIRSEFLQQHGYGTTRAKVEALWAFVVAHEKVVEGAPILERFPVLVQCIRRVVDVVRADLRILEELQPRRFFYAKHALALRVMMNRRLEKVRRLTEEGWLSSADSEGLVASLQGRIVQVERFLPRLRSMERVVGARPCELAQAPMAPAWQDVDLVHQAHRESLCSSDGHRASTSRASAKSSRSSCGVDVFVAPRAEAWRAPAGHEQLFGSRTSTPVLLGAPSERPPASAGGLKPLCSHGVVGATGPETSADAASTADTLENLQ